MIWSQFTYHNWLTFNAGNMIVLHRSRSTHRNTTAILWRQAVTTFHQSTQSNHWNGYPDTRFNTRSGNLVLKYTKNREPSEASGSDEFQRTWDCSRGGKAGFKCVEAVGRIIIRGEWWGAGVVFCLGWSKVQTTLWSTYKLCDLHAMFHSILLVSRSI